MNAMPLWTLEAMIAAMRAEANGVLPQAITGISIDSRTLGPGEAYFAIKGAVHDGHDFVAAALKAGGSSDGAPGLRPEYHGGYYAAFIRDPDGNRIEAVTFLRDA